MQVIMELPGLLAPPSLSLVFITLYAFSFGGLLFIANLIGKVYISLRLNLVVHAYSPCYDIFSLVQYDSSESLFENVNM